MFAQTSLSSDVLKGCVGQQVSFLICMTGVRSLRTVKRKAAKIILSVLSNISGWRNTINFRFKVKWQTVLLLWLWLTTGLCSLKISYNSHLHSWTHHPFIYISFHYHHRAMLIMFHFPDFPLLFLHNVKQGCFDFLLPSFLRSIPKPHSSSIISVPCILCIISLFPHLLSFMCTPLYSCHVSILSIFPYVYLLPQPSLCLFPFTPFASDLVRHPLSTWLKSSGPTGGAKPWVCFPSERLLFAHSGN